MPKNEFINIKSQIKSSVYQVVNALDGSYSAEHGIGLAKKEELKCFSSKQEIELMKIIKKSLDPNNIMNSNKIL
jgi:FAD/FMN-containing dehydrogenase